MFWDFFSLGQKYLFMRGQIAYAIAEARIEVLPPFFVAICIICIFAGNNKKGGVLVFILDTPIRTFS